MENKKASRDIICPKCGKTVNPHPVKTYNFNFYRELYVYTCNRCGVHFAVAENFGLEKVEVRKLR